MPARVVKLSVVDTRATAWWCAAPWRAAQGARAGKEGGDNVAVACDAKEVTPDISRIKGCAPAREDDEGTPRGSVCRASTSPESCRLSARVRCTSSSSCESWRQSVRCPSATFLRESEFTFFLLDVAI